ncbi:MAG: MBOAT family protein [Treponemataceae bacterium]|nr:MBOAT family protein [Treponemataceae bacterium]
MVFSSLIFLFVFLPAVLLVYCAVPRRLKNGALFLFSLVFYAWGEPVYVLVMLASIALSFAGGIAISTLKQSEKPKRAKAALIVCSALNVSMLAFFKYADFAIGTVNGIFGTDARLLHLALPIGISFYTFQTLSYLIDVYRSETPALKNFVSYGTYIALFPQLIAGPIVQYKTVAAQLASRTNTAAQFANGIRRFLLGLGKKVLLANNIGLLWNAVREMDASAIPAMTAWLGIVAFALQIYFDFSGYSDMAIGLGRMFGFSFPENFDHPYESKSIAEFWRRWHISLGRWFRDYVYIPLGGSRAGRMRHIRNIFVVWLLTGLWHGASWNFVAWGAYYAVLLLAEKFVFGAYIEKLPPFFRHCCCMALVMFGWALFAFETLGEGVSFIGTLFGAGGGFANGETIYLLYNNAVLLVLCAVCCTGVPKRIAAWACGKFSGGRIALSAVRNAAYASVFVLSAAYLVDASFNPFLYFRF